MGELVSGKCVIVIMRTGGFYLLIAILQVLLVLVPSVRPDMP